MLKLSWELLPLKNSFQPPYGLGTDELLTSEINACDDYRARVTRLLLVRYSVKNFE